MQTVNFENEGEQKGSKVQHFSGCGKQKEEVDRNMIHTLGEKIATAF